MADGAHAQIEQALWSVLPGPCSMTVSGVVDGPWRQRLAEAGYRVSGLSDERARTQPSPAADASAATSSPCELLLVLGTAQAADPLSLFEAADRVLRSGPAHLVLIGELALEARRGELPAPVPARSHLLALARRMGWEPVHERDLGDAARQILATAPATSSDAAPDATRACLQRLTDGRSGYRLLSMTRPQPPALRLGAVGPGQSQAMRDLFAKVFGRPMSEAEWQWKYGQGRGCAVGLWQGPTLLAHYGALTRPVLVDGRLQPCCQVGDVMVLPEANAGLGRQGALQQVSATLLEAQIGWGAPHLLGFGFPSARAMQVAERLGLYVAVDEVVQLEWHAPPAARAVDRWWRLDECDPACLAEGSRAWAELQRLWGAMARAWPRTLLPQRDAAWWRHRFGNRPGVRYRLLMQKARLSGRVAGAMVLREHDDHVELIDLVGRPNGFVRLVRAARLVAARSGRPQLRTWITVSHAAWLDDAADPARRVTIDVQVPSCAHTPGPGADELRGRWFLMPGDTDFR